MTLAIYKASFFKIYFYLMDCVVLKGPVSDNRYNVHKTFVLTHPVANGPQNDNTFLTHSVAQGLYILCILKEKGGNKLYKYHLNACVYYIFKLYILYLSIS
jgi:hypothetical protein